MNKSLFILILFVDCGHRRRVRCRRRPPKLEPVPLPSVLVAKPEATNLPQQKEITKSNGEYVAAFNKGDFDTPRHLLHRRRRPYGRRRE